MTATTDRQKILTALSEFLVELDTVGVETVVQLIKSNRPEIHSRFIRTDVRRARTLLLDFRLLLSEPQPT